MGIPIITTVAGEWLNILIFHDNNKCITANGQTILNVATDKICHVMIILFMQKNLEVLNHS